MRVMLVHSSLQSSWLIIPVSAFVSTTCKSLCMSILLYHVMSEKSDVLGTTPFNEQSSTPCVVSSWTESKTHSVWRSLAILVTSCLHWTRQSAVVSTWHLKHTYNVSLLYYTDYVARQWWCQGLRVGGVCGIPLHRKFLFYFCVRGNGEFRCILVWCFISPEEV